MDSEELKQQIAKLDQQITNFAQQAEQAKANWNYARGIREGLASVLAKMQTEQNKQATEPSQ